MTPADSVAEVARLEGLRGRPRELLAGVDGGEPEAELVGEVVARTAAAVALDERAGPEVLEAGAGAGERLATTLGARAGVLRKISK